MHGEAKMHEMRKRFGLVSLIFILALVVVGSEGNRKFLETIFGYRDEINKETAEQVWIDCWKEICYTTQTIENFPYKLQYEVENAILGLPPKEKHSLLDCLEKRNHLLGTPNDDRPYTTWFEKFFNLFSDWSNVPRRNLKSRHKQKHHRHHKKRSPKLNPSTPEKSHRRHKAKSPKLDPTSSFKSLNVAPNRKDHHKKRSTKLDPNASSASVTSTQNQKNNKKRSPKLNPKTSSTSLIVSPEKRHNHKTKSPILASPNSHHHHHKTKSLISAPTPSSSSKAFAPRPSLLEPSRSPDPTPVPSPSPVQYSPEPSIAPLISPPPKLNPLHSPIIVKNPPPKLDPNPSGTSENDTRRYKIIASVAAAVALLMLVALIFFCCIKRDRNKVGPKEGQKDENPLINLCMSSMAGSGEKSQGAGNSSKKFAVNSSKKFSKTSSTVKNKLTASDKSSPPQNQSSESPKTNNNTSSAASPPPLSLPVKKDLPSAPPPPPPKPPTPSPPPPLKSAAKPPPPAPFGKPSPHQRGRSSSGGEDAKGESEHKAKLKPFFWDKVNPDQSMVWNDLKAGSFQVNEEMMETLFGYTPAEKTKNEQNKGSSPYNSPQQFIQIIDPKKSQNLAILLKALNVTTEEVCDALKEGNELPVELIQTLLKMAPTTEEELKLRLFNGELSQLGPAERFLKAMVEIPFSFKRLESLLFISSVREEVSSIKESFETLEVACTELKNSRLFLKLLEAVLKTGNRMNDGTYRGGAQAFKLDTLLKLSDVKGTDGKTTLLHFVVQEIIRSEGVRAARTARESNQSIMSVQSDDLNDNSTPENADYYRNLGLNVVSGLSSDLENVKKAAIIDGDSLTSTVLKLGTSFGKVKGFLDNEMESLQEESEFRKKLESFSQSTDDEIMRLVEEEKRIMLLVKGTVEYFYGKGAKNEGLRLFVIVRDFLIILDKACKEVRNSEKMPVRAQRREALSPSNSADSCSSMPDLRQRLFPAIMAQRRDDDSSSDDEGFSP